MHMTPSVSFSILTHSSSHSHLSPLDLPDRAGHSSIELESQQLEEPGKESYKGHRRMRQ